MRILDDSIFSGAAIVADVATESVDLSHITGYSVQIDWTSTTAAGTIKVQMSNDGKTWDDTGSSQAISNDSGTVVLNFADVFYKYTRVFVDWTSGSITTLDVIVCGKGF